MCLHFDIHHSDMDPTRTGNFFPCNLKMSNRKKRRKHHYVFIVENLRATVRAKLIKANIKHKERYKKKKKNMITISAGNEFETHCFICVHKIEPVNRNK